MIQVIGRPINWRCRDTSGPTVVSKRAVGTGLPRPAPIMQFEKYMWIIEEAKSSAQTDFKIRIKFSNCMIGLACPLPDKFVKARFKIL
ncbi:MAG: hypothetical protein ACJ8AG_19635 [Ktedonobacteraceae bacterium]